MAARTLRPALARAIHAACASIEPLECRRLLSSSVSDGLVGAGENLTGNAPARQVEFLNRGVVAIRTGGSGTGSIYVGWRMLGTDPADIAFNLYASINNGPAAKVNGAPITNSTNFVHTNQNYGQSHTYFVRPVINGVEQADSESFTLPANAPQRQYINVPLQIPPGGTTPSGEAYTYSANDASVGDVDGDGDYEIILKWEPSNAHDNSHSGYTGNVYIDAYDFDGQGNSTRLWRIDLGRNIRAGAHYTQFMVYDFDGDGKAEVAMKTAPGTIDGQGNPVLLGNATVDDDYRNSAGYILSGPEYFTVFSGLTGANMATTNYLPPRGSVSSWGDNYGNRVDRFLAGVAYLDGQRPSIIMARGYYTRAVIVAWDWRDGQLTRRWTFDSNQPGNGAYAGQGNHQLSIADVDADGFDEIIYGAATIDHDGTGLYSTGLGHGDALHVSDMDPNRPGLEVWTIHEPSGVPGGDLHDAGTGQILVSTAINSGEGPGRGVAADIYAANPGYELWGAGGVLSTTGANLGIRTPSSSNHLAWWDADPLRELVNSNVVDKYGTSGDTRLLTASGASSSNGSKSNPALTADIYGDWREEIIWKASNSSALRIYTTTIPSDWRTYTLMHDTQYRVAVAWQNVAYNQPPHPSFFLGAANASGAFPTIPAANVYYPEIPDPPAAPGGVAATPVTSGRIDLSWNAVDGADKYIIRRSTTIGGPYETVASDVIGTSYSDTSVTGPGIFFYTVAGSNAGGQGDASSPVSATISAPLILQAENQVFGNGAATETTNGNYNGASYINFPTTGGYLQFNNVNGFAGGSQTLRIRYALGAAADRTGLLIVNGVSRNITFTPTGAWNIWAVHEVTVNLNAGTNNTIRFESNGQDLANIDELRIDAPADGVAPTASNPQYVFTTTPHTLRVTFSEDVSASLTAGDLVIASLNGGPAFMPASVSYNHGTNVATFTLPGAVANGYYRASFMPGSVMDAAMNPLGNPLINYDFFILPGDINRDEAVDNTDLAILSANWQGTNKTFAQGDLNNDTRVDIADLTILTSNWQQTVAMPSSLTATVEPPPRAKAVQLRRPTRPADDLATPETPIV